MNESAVNDKTKCCSKKAMAVEWLVGEVINSRGWEQTQGPADVPGTPVILPRISLAAESKTERVQRIQALINECSSASGGNKIGVPPFEITVSQDAQGNETYTIDLVFGKGRKKSQT